MKSNLIKAFLLLVICTISIPGFSQNKKATAPINTSKKDSLICKNWKLLGIEEFGVLNKPGSKQQNDIANFSPDHHARVIHDGEEINGTWSADKGFSYVTVTVEGSTAKRPYKILKLTKDSLMMEYQDAVLVRTRYLYTNPK